MSAFFSADSLMALYLAACIVLAVAVHFFPVFDQRRLAPVADERFTALGFFERPDRALLIFLLGIVALGLAVYLGWRLPLEIERVATGQGGLQPFAPSIETGTIGRAAQVVGAVCFALMALRMMRWSLIVAFTVAMIALALAAYAYVFT